MPEWPKIMVARLVRIEGRSSVRTTDETEVIPADLGRELYDSMRHYLSYPTLVGRRQRVEDALTRYEREVGNA